MEQYRINTSHFNFCPLIGFGYWKDIYKKEKIGMDGLTHNIILPFMRIQWGFLVVEK